jgi:uncharacterized protein YqgC (DUF456 family)
MIGFAGCILPGLPGPQLNYIGMLLVQYAITPYDRGTLIVFGIITIAILILDYFIPVWFAKKSGATKQGIWGSIIGLCIGMFFTPIGMIAGMLIGAILGDLIAGRTSVQATKSGIATFTGTLFTIGLKLCLAAIITVYVIMEIVRYLF